MKKYGLYAMFIAVMFAYVGGYAYAAQIELGLNQYSFEMCPYSTQAFDGFVKNTGSESAEIKVYADGSWVVAAPDSFILNPGEVQNIKFFITPDGDAKPGEYRIKIIAYSKELGEVENEIKVTILNCHDINIQVSDDYERIQACIGDVVKIPFDLTNDGKVTELVNVKVEANNGNLEFEQTELNPGEIERDYLYYKVVQEYDVITLKAESVYSFAHAEKKIYVSGRNCYDFDMTVVPQSTDACKGDTVTFKIYVENKGEEKNKITLESSYGTLSDTELYLNPGQKAEVVLEAVANKEGNIAIDVTAKSKYKVDVKNVQINSMICKDGTVVLVPQHMEACKGSAARFVIVLKNKGDEAMEGYLSTTLGDVEKEKIVVEPKQTIYKEVYIPTEELDYGNYTFEVKYEGEDVYDVAKANLTVKNCYNGEITTDYKLVKVCALTPSGKVVFKVKNTGEKPETYYLKGEYGWFETPTITLQPGGVKKVNYIINVSDDVGEGIIEDTIVLEGMHMFKPKETTLEIEVLPTRECSNYTVDVEPETINAYEYRGYIYYVNIKNNGLAENEFKIEIEDKPEYVYVEPPKLTLKPGEEGKFFIYIAPTEKLPNKEYVFEGKVVDKYGVDKKFEIRFNLMAEKAVPTAKEDRLKVVVEGFDKERIYTVNRTHVENITIKYYMEGRMEEEQISFMAGSFIVQVGDELYEDQEPEIGEKTYTLIWNNKTYKITVEFLKVDNENSEYKFRVERIEIIKDITPIYATPEEKSWLEKYWPWLIPLAVLIIGLILVALDVMDKDKEDERETREEILKLKEAIEQ
ncbi:MAG: hypothetical protein GXN99_02855 [Candidatus Nanohaloarchaeota archaeon]|nr:hypothetical protein [Candidatus Nanohaloarchaeota archaeon]